MRPGDVLLICRRIRLVCATLLLSIATGSAEEHWLTQPETDFFTALGIDAEVDGKQLSSAAHVDQFPEIAKRAPDPLSKRILTISEAFGQLEVSEEEKKALKEAQDKVQSVVKGKVTSSLLTGALAGNDLSATAGDAVKGALKDGKVIKALEFQRDSLARRLKARDRGESTLKEILSDLETRVGKTRPASDIAWQIEVDGKKMRVMGKPSTEVGFPIVQVVLHKKPPNKDGSVANLTSGKIADALGVNQADSKALDIGVALAQAHELSASLPVVTTSLLPDLNAQSTVGFSFPIESSLALEKVDVKIWSKEGILIVESVAGLEAVQKKAHEIQDEEATKRMTPQQRAVQARQREAAAKASLKFAQTQLGAKNVDVARKAFNQVIEFAPDSAAAKAARAALKKLDE